MFFGCLLRTFLKCRSWFTLHTVQLTHVAEYKRSTMFGSLNHLLRRFAKYRYFGSCWPAPVALWTAALRDVNIALIRLVGLLAKKPPPPPPPHAGHMDYG